MKKIEIDKDGIPYNLGKDAYESGLITVEQAKATNPYLGFGKLAEHVRYVNWNRGWNDAMRKAKGEKS